MMHSLSHRLLISGREPAGSGPDPRASAGPPGGARKSAAWSRRCARAGRARNRRIGPVEPSAWLAPAGRTVGSRRSASDGETLAALGAAGIDHRSPTARLHADEESVRAGTADFGGLVGAFHVDFRAAQGALCCGCAVGCGEGRAVPTWMPGSSCRPCAPFGPEGNPRLQQDRRAPSTCGLLPATAERSRHACFPLWITGVAGSSKRTMARFDGPLFHICGPISGSAVANVLRPSCLTSNSTPGSGRSPKPT